MRARSLAGKIALSLGLPLALAGAPACKKSEDRGERPARPVASADHEASCERGTFCVPPQATLEVAAPPPFDRCSVITPLPPGVPAGWPQERRAKLRIWFHADTSTAARRTDPDACCYEWREHCAGRPLRDGGRPLVARAAADPGGWAAGGAAIVPAGERCPEAAAHWLENALAEHASVAAFARVALDLLALGAPADLVAGAHAAALDEVRHARLSFALAASLGAHAAGPGPLPEVARALRPPSPVAVLAETFRDGAIGEAAAALVLASAARRARGPLSDMLSHMAEDEARHAELAWRTVQWLARTFPDAAGALQREVDRLCIEPASAPSRAVSRGAGGRRGGRRGRLDRAARYGVWGAEDVAGARRRAVAEIAVPVGGALLRRRTAGSA